MQLGRKWRYLAVLVALAGCGRDLFAFTANIGTGTRAIFLQVGNGSFTGTYSGGGTPKNNATINVVSVCVPPVKVPPGMGSAPASPLPLEVQLTWLNGIVSPVALVRFAADVVTVSVAVPALPGSLKNPPM
ncbi:MAG TPA: hypothetical protein VLL50_01890 [Usitatibacter sp.]|nr:hypothetical protein [Usitatibacter sp.]